MAFATAECHQIYIFCPSGRFFIAMCICCVEERVTHPIWFGKLRAMRFGLCTQMNALPTIRNFRFTSDGTQQTIQIDAYLLFTQQMARR